MSGLAIEPPLAVADHLEGPLQEEKFMVLRVYFDNYPAASRWTTSEVEDVFSKLSSLWSNTSYGALEIDYLVSPLFQLPDDDTDYVNWSQGRSPGGMFRKVLEDAVANAPASLDWTDVTGVFVLMAETDASNFHRAKGRRCNDLALGPGEPEGDGVPCIIALENPSESYWQVVGRMAHEIGHTIQAANDEHHPSNYLSEYEVMDSNYPGHTGAFEKQYSGGFPGWLSSGRYQLFTPETGGGVASIWAREYHLDVEPNYQAAKIEVSGGLYYLVSVARRVLGDELNGAFGGIPDEGVLIERVVESADQMVLIQGNGGSNNTLWDVGDAYSNTSDGVFIRVYQRGANDSWNVQISYTDQADRPDVMINPWRSPPGNAYETTDIWVDSPVNGYGTYRYGVRSTGDWAGTVVGNGDDPALGQINRLYARVRNLGYASATDVEVKWEVTDPLGAAFSANWVEVGSVDADDFTGLAEIEAGGFVDVYTDWVPEADVSAADLEAGYLGAHTCIRVMLTPVEDETVLGNQDGQGEQENLVYFQLPAPGEGEEDASATFEFREDIELKNEDASLPRSFDLYYETNLPPGSDVDLNDGEYYLDLGPGESRSIPVHVKMPVVDDVGTSYWVDVAASRHRLLVSDQDPGDVHDEFKGVGGVRLEIPVVDETSVFCEAERASTGRVHVSGELAGLGGAKQAKTPLVVLLEGIDAKGHFLPKTMILAGVSADGTFSGNLTEKEKTAVPESVVCAFAGTTTLASASSGAVPVTDAGGTSTEADLVLDKTASAPSVKFGEKALFTLTVRNEGPATATGVVVQDDLPKGATSVQAKASRGVCGGSNPLVCKIGTMKSGETVTITVLLTPAANGTLTNSASVVGKGQDPDPGNNEDAASVQVGGEGATTQTEALGWIWTLGALAGVLAAMRRGGRAKRP